MPKNNQHQYLGRRGQVLVWLIAVLGTISALLYFEQIAVIYILSTIALVLLLVFVAFSDLETVGVKAREEAYMTYRTEGVFPQAARHGNDSGVRAVGDSKALSGLIKPLTGNMQN